MPELMNQALDWNAMAEAGGLIVIIVGTTYLVSRLIDLGKASNANRDDIIKTTVIGQQEIIQQALDKQAEGAKEPEEKDEP